MVSFSAAEGFWCSSSFTSILVSQFTLLASTKKSKPDFHGAMGGAQAKELYDYFFSQIQKGYSAERVMDGVFQAMMEVGLVNDGPVRNQSAAGRLTAS